MEHSETADHIGARPREEGISSRVNAHGIRIAQRRADLVVYGAIFVLAILAVWAGPLVEGGIPRGDSFSFFVPMYSFMGERLRAFDIPGWNPYVLSGAPFSGDPESGWMYLPAMLPFTLLPPVAAYSVYALFHLVLAGVATYLLGRLLGLGVVGAAVAAIAYQFTPFVEGATCCSIRTHIASWLPLALLGVELALRATDWHKRVVAWSVSGLAISQMLAGWIGQGAYYGLLAVGAFLFFRAVISPPLSQPHLAARLAQLLTTGTAILLIGFGLAAAGVLPRIDVTNRSNLAGGVYQETAAEKAVTGGWPPILALDRILSADGEQARWYLGGALFVLAVVGIAVARRRSLALFFVLLSTAALIMTLDPTPLHRLLYALPQFQVLHEHVPNRVMVAFFLGPALLAGMTIDAIARPTNHSRLSRGFLLVPPLLIAASYVALTRAGREIGQLTIFGAIAACLLLGLAAFLPTSLFRTGRQMMALRTLVIPAILALLILWDPTGEAIMRVVRAGEAIPRVPAELQELSCLAPPSGAAGALQQKEQGLVRFFSYDARILQAQENPNYRQHLREAPVQRLLAGNQAICLHLYDIQGYNPVQPLRYVQYMTALNGGAQEYHESNVLPNGVESPLLDLLNAGFLIVPADADFLTRRPFRKYPAVYEDSEVRVLARPSALPRAWLVHEAQRVGEGEALALLVSDAFNYRRTAILEAEPPPLDTTGAHWRESVHFTRYEPDRLDLRVTAEANGLLMLSEVWDPGWSATVDGEPVPVLVADHVLRAVPVPEGDHVVFLRYDPPSLRIGLVIAVVTALLLCGAIAWLWWRKAQYQPTA